MKQRFLSLIPQRGHVLFALDLFLLLLAWPMALALPVHWTGWLAMLLVPVVWAAMSESLYHPQRGAVLSSWTQLLRGTWWIALVTVCVWALADSPLWLSPDVETSAILLHGGYMLCAVLASHWGARTVVYCLQQRGVDCKTAVICGKETAAEAVHVYLKAHPGLGFTLADAGPCWPSQLPQVVTGGRIQTIFLAAPDDALRSAARKLAGLTGAEILEVLDAASAASVAPRWIGSLAVAPLNSTPFHHMAFKRLLDILLAGTLGILVLPLLVVIACMVKLTSPGPVFFRQRRLAFGGRTFTILKFRTMIVHEGPETSIHTERDDPRITWFGGFLRSTYLDELPQLWNVLSGDMSLVGPRPERHWAADHLTREIEGYGLRLSVKPGLTGLAQVSGLHGDGACDMRKRVEKDLDYIARFSLLTDLGILARTALRTFGFK